MRVRQRVVVDSPYSSGDRERDDEEMQPLQPSAISNVPAGIWTELPDEERRDVDDDAAAAAPRTPRSSAATGSSASQIGMAKYR